MDGSGLSMDNWTCLAMGISGFDLIGCGHLIGPSPNQSVGNWIISELALESPIGPVLVEQLATKLAFDTNSGGDLHLRRWHACAATRVAPDSNAAAAASIHGDDVAAAARVRDDAAAAAACLRELDFDSFSFPDFHFISSIQHRCSPLWFSTASTRCIPISGNDAHGILQRWQRDGIHDRDDSMCLRPRPRTRRGIPDGGGGRL